MKIKAHKFEGVDFVPTIKMGKGNITGPKFIVLHFTAGWTTEGDIHTLAKSDRQASAHCVLSRQGAWTQIVPFNRVAWHAGPSKWKGYVGLNQYSIGIEVSNIGYLKKFSNGLYADEYGNQLDGEGNFLRGNRKAESAPKDWHEHYNPILAKGNTYVWEPFYPAQLDALEAGVQAMLDYYPSIQEIVTHEEIDTRGWKTDINGGRGFPMKRFTDLLKNDPKDDRKSGDVIIAEVKGTLDKDTMLPEARVDVPLHRTNDINEYSVPLTTVPSGEKIKVLHADEKWARVEFNGILGWMQRIRIRLPD